MFRGLQHLKLADNMMTNELKMNALGSKLFRRFEKLIQSLKMLSVSVACKIKLFQSFSIINRPSETETN